MINLIKQFLQKHKQPLSHLVKGLLILCVLMAVVHYAPVYGMDAPQEYRLDFKSFTQPINFSSSINLLLALTSITLLPFLLMSTTCFLRTIIVLGFIRNALSTQSTPPNQILISIGLFITIFVMMPTYSEINKTAIVPYQKGEISQQRALELGLQPIRNFMLKFTREKDLALFMEFADIRGARTINEVPTFVIIPAFIISELKTAFQIGFLLFIPMIVVDLIVSNILLSLGMFMLSPVMISMPFKLLLFVLADGWNVIIRGLLLSYQ